MWRIRLRRNHRNQNKNFLFDYKPKCTIINGDSRGNLVNCKENVDLIITSPPYADARKKHYDSIHPDKFPDWFLTFHESFWNALKPEGSLVINIKDKVVEGVRHRFVWRTIEKLMNAGWQAIDDYIWHKTNPMPGYWPTRLRDGWEYCFHLAKSKRPFMNQDAVKMPMGDWAESRLKKLGEGDKSRNNSANQSGFGRDLSRWVGKNTVLPSNVLSIALVGKNKGHPAVFPIELPSFFIKLLSSKGGLVVDPFAGSGSTGIAALSLDRDCLLIDTHKEYCDLAYTRLFFEAPIYADIIYSNISSIESIIQEKMTKKTKQKSKRNGEMFVEDLLAMTTPEFIQNVKEARAIYKAGKSKSHKKVC
ncbi:MAG: site-specific DNA-methyltransferase [Nitrospiraceae bacterium]|nr:MAG: site-specific DNA-methyltransferase [Nitrospiraceae bacterium]